ncbi:Myb/SANT-like domain-containing protein [Tanacetum coccineum]
MMNKKVKNVTDCKREFVSWTPEMDDTYINAMLKEKYKGNRTGGTFTSQAYANMVEELNKTLKLNIGQKHLKNRIRTIKEHFAECYDVFRGTTLSGFAWNPVSELIEAEEEVWKDLIEVRIFRPFSKDIPSIHDSFPQNCYASPFLCFAMIYSMSKAKSSVKQLGWTAVQVRSNTIGSSKAPISDVPSFFLTIFSKSDVLLTPNRRCNPKGNGMTSEENIKEKVACLFRSQKADIVTNEDCSWPQVNRSEKTKLTLKAPLSE